MAIADATRQNLQNRRIVKNCYLMWSIYIFGMDGWPELISLNGDETVWFVSLVLFFDWKKTVSWKKTDRR